MTVDRLGFYEFFAGGGLARLGLGQRWTCLLANDICAKKAAAYRGNFGTSPELVVDDLRRRARLGVIPLPGSLACRQRPGSGRRTQRDLSSVLDPDRRTGAPRAPGPGGRHRKRGWSIEL